MRCLNCKVVLRSPKGKTRELQICAICRRSLGRPKKEDRLIIAKRIETKQRGIRHYRSTKFKEYD